MAAADRAEGYRAQLRPDKDWQSARAWAAEVEVAWRIVLLAAAAAAAAQAIHSVEVKMAVAVGIAAAAAVVAGILQVAALKVPGLAAIRHRQPRVVKRAACRRDGVVRKIDRQQSRWRVQGGYRKATKKDG